MALSTTSLAPIEKSVRDRLKAYKEDQGLSNYNEAVEALLDGAGIEVTQQD